MEKSACNLLSPEEFVRDYGDRAPHAYSKLLAEVIRHGKAGTIVDLGCGLGLFVELAQMWGLDAIGLEGSPYAVERAHARAAGINVKLHDLGEPLPFADRSVANILLNQVIEHLDPVRARKLLGECFRILESGGVALITSPSRLNLHERRDPSHINLLLPIELKASLEETGFQVVSQPDYGFWFDSRGLPVLNVVAEKLMRVLPHDWISSTANAIVRKP